MKKVVYILSCLIATYLFTYELVVAAAGGDILQGQARIIDADTIAIGDARVRFHGVDAPELRTIEGLVAKQAMEKLVAGDDVVCLIAGNDKYGRHIGRCFTQDVYLNASIIASGCAKAYRKYSMDYVRYEGKRSCNPSKLFIVKE